MEKRNKILTFVLALIPGLGQIYLGEVNVGIQLLAAFIMINPVLNVIGVGFLANIMQLVIWGYSFFDTLDIAKSMDRKENLTNVNNDPGSVFVKVENESSNKGYSDKSSLIIGWSLVIVGIVAVLNRSFWNYELYGIIKSFVSIYFMPLLLIILGAYMLLKNRRL